MKQQKSLNTLSIDIGGTGIKMMVLDAKGEPLTERLRVETPHPAKYDAVIEVLKTTIKEIKVPFHRVSAGFPGVILNGVVKTAFNLHPSWVDVNFQHELETITSCPARVANDADVQGLGDISGRGVELVITLGTGMGSSLFVDGKLVPNLQMAHHPFRNKRTYEDLLGEKALKKNGNKKWQKNLKKAIVLLHATFNYDHLYIGGGNARKISFKLPETVTLTDNIEGILGGLKLWEQ